MDAAARYIHTQRHQPSDINSIAMSRGILSHPPNMTNVRSMTLVSSLQFPGWLDFQPHLLIK
jgi:hypothetical protein